MGPMEKFTSLTKKILKFDEKCFSLDDSKGKGSNQRLLSMIRTWCLPYNDKRKIKDSLSLMATLVCASKAAGKALSLHFPFQTRRHQRIKGRGWEMMFSINVCELWVSLGLRVKDHGIQSLASTKRGEWMTTSSRNMCSTQSSLSTQTHMTGLVIIFF